MIKVTDKNQQKDDRYHGWIITMSPSAYACVPLPIYHICLCHKNYPFLSFQYLISPFQPLLVRHHHIRLLSAAQPPKEVVFLIYFFAAEKYWHFACFQWKKYFLDIFVSVGKILIFGRFSMKEIFFLIYLSLLKNICQVLNGTPSKCDVGRRRCCWCM